MAWRFRTGSGTGALSVRDFRWLFAGQTVSSIGDQVFPVAVTLRIIDSGGGASDIGLVLAGRAAAMVLFIVLGGVLADRVSRTRVMIMADVMRFVAVLALALTPGDVPVVALALLTFGVGAGEAFFRPAYGALVPGVLSEEQLPSGNALTGVSFKTSMLIGPALAATLVELGGSRGALLFDASTFLVSMLTLLRISEQPLAARERNSPLRDAIDGVRAVRQRPWIGAILVMALLQVMLAIAPYTVLLPVIATDRLGGKSAYAGILTAFAIGGLLGAVIGGKWQPRRMGLWALLGLLPHVGLLLSMAYSGSPWPIGVWAFVAGVGLEPFIVWWTSALQRDVPRDLLARVISLDWLISLGLLPVGLALTGPAVRAFGEEKVLWVAALTILVTSLAPLAVPGVVELRTPAAGTATPLARVRGRLRPHAVTRRP